MRRLFYAILIAACFATTGCAGLWKDMLPIVTKIIVAIIDAEQQLSYIEKGIDSYFEANPDKSGEATIRDSLARTRAALNIASRAAYTGKVDYDKAFEEFRKTWDELLSLLKTSGIVSAEEILASGPYSGIKIIEPLAVKGGM